MTSGGPSDVLVVGYGTLLYRASLGSTLGRTTKERQMVPVTMRGFRRLFNLRADHYPSSDLWGRSGIENGAMNVEPAPGESLNGLAFRVSPKELEKLDRREYCYDRLQVEAHDFKTGVLLGPAHIYSARRDGRWIERDPAKLLPLWRDVAWARAGTYAVSRRFGEAFDRTTYLADGRTLVAERYRDHLSPGEPPRVEDLPPR